MTMFVGDAPVSMNAGRDCSEVCVPAEWGDDDAEAFAVRRNANLEGRPTEVRRREPCHRRDGFAHVVVGVAPEKS